MAHGGWAGGGTGCAQGSGSESGKRLSSAEQPEGPNPGTAVGFKHHNGGQIVTNEVAPWGAKAHGGHKAG